MHPPRRQGRNPQAGITLVELLISMIIMSIVTTMLIGAWISLQRAYATTSAKNNATANARFALDRISSEIRSAQGMTFTPSPSPSTSTPFYPGATIPYRCDANDCVFYSAYNNPLAAGSSGQFGRGQLLLTAIWLDTQGSQAQKTLWWERNTSGNGLGDPGNRKIKLATNVVNSAAAINRPIFTYMVRNSTTGLPSPAATLGTANVASLLSVQIELVADANLKHTPTYVDLLTTVEPRNLSSHQ